MILDYIFVFFRNRTNTSVVISVSNPVEFTNYEKPSQPHLALTGYPNEMR